MAELGILEEDLEEQFIQGSGSGGQKINKTASCIFLKHKPTGTVIKCQRSRSRELNRYHARELLCFRFEEEAREKRLQKQAEKAKTRQQNRKPTKAQKTQNIEAKKRRSSKKSLRKSPKMDD